MLKNMRLALLALLIFLPGCEKLRETQKSLGDLAKIQKVVQQTTGLENVNVILNNDRYLNIGLINSPWKSLPADAKAAKARQVASAALAAYPGANSLARISVTYITNRTYFLVVHYTDATDNYSFDPMDLRQGSPASTPL